MATLTKASKFVCLAVASILKISPVSIDAYRYGDTLFAELSKSDILLKSERCLRKIEEINLMTGVVFESVWVSSKALADCSEPSDYIRINNCPSSIDIGVLINEVQIKNKISMQSMRCDISSSEIHINSATIINAEVEWNTLKIKRFWTDVNATVDSFLPISQQHACDIKNLDVIETNRVKSKKLPANEWGEYREWLPEK